MQRGQNGKPNTVWPARAHALEEFKMINKYLLSFFLERKRATDEGAWETYS